MAVYIPQQGDQTDFELSAYTVPPSDQVNFELLESVGTQVVVWENLSVAEYTEFSLEVTYKVIQEYEEFLASEYVELLFTEYNLETYDVLGTVEEGVSVRLPFFNIIELQDIAVTEVLVDIGLDTLFTLPFEDINILESPELKIAWRLVIDEDLIVVEDVQILDLVVEIFDSLDYIEIEEHFETWTDWHNLWSPIQDITTLESSIIARNPTDIDLKYEDFVISEFAGIAPWAYFTDRFDSITAEDVLERLLVGHFPYPLEFVSVEDVAVDVWVYPPYPSPWDEIGVEEYWTHEMIPPSLSWIAEYPVITEYLVVGEDPHYADLGFQEITVTEAPVLYPNPLYVEVQDFGDIVPFVRDWAKWDVGYPVNVSETLLLIDELVVFYIGSLIPNVHDQVGHLEAVEFYWDTLGEYSAHDNIGITEVLNIALSQVFVSAHEDISIEEQFEGWAGQEIFVYDEVGDPVEEFVYVLDLVIELHPFEEMLMAYDVAFVQFADLFIPDNYEDVSIAEYNEFFVGQEIFPDDSVTVSEDFKFGMTPIPLYVIEDVYVSEYVDRTGVPQIFVWDFIELNEFFLLAPEIIDLITYDEITVLENISGIIALPLTIDDEVGVTESFASFLSAWNLFVYDFSSVVEAAVLQPPSHTLEVYEDILLTEWVYVFDNVWRPSVSDEVSLEDSAYILPLYWEANVHDTASVIEAIVVSGLLWHLYAEDNISVDEMVWAFSVREIEVFDSVSVEEWVEVWGLLWHVSVFEDVSVEDVESILLPEIRAYEEILVSEWIYLSLPALTVFEEISLEEFAYLGKLTLLTFSFEDIGAEEYAEGIIAYPVVVDDDIGVAEVYIKVLLEGIPLVVHDFLLVQDFVFLEDLTWFIDVFDETAAEEWFLGGGLAWELEIEQSFTVYEFAWITPDVLYVFPDEYTTIFEAPEIELRSYLDTYDDLTISEVISPVLVYLVEIHDTFGITEYFIAGLNPIPIYEYEDIILQDVPNVLIPINPFSVYENVGIQEVIGASVDIHNYLTAHQNIYVVEEYVKLIVIVFAFTYDEISIDEWVELFFPFYNTFVYDGISVDEYATQQTIELIFAQDTVSIIEVANIRDGVFLVAFYDDVFIEEFTDIETTGIAVYPHQNIFKTEWVDVALDVLNFAVLDSVFVSEQFLSTGIKVSDPLLVEDVITIEISALYIEVYEDSIVEDYFDGFTYDFGVLPIFESESIGIAESPAAYPDPLWTGIQVDFITAEDIFVDSLVGFLINAVETISVDEYAAYEIQFLSVDVYDAIFEPTDYAGVWFSFYGFAYGVEILFTEEAIELYLDTLYLDVYDEISIAEFADRIEGFNVPILYDEAFAWDVLIGLHLDVLNLHYFFGSYWHPPKDTVSVDEWVQCGGLLIQLFAYDDISVRSENGEWLFQKGVVVVELDSLGIDTPYDEIFVVSEFAEGWVYLIIEGQILFDSLSVLEWADAEYEWGMIRIADGNSRRWIDTGFPGKIGYMPYGHTLSYGVWVDDRLTGILIDPFPMEAVDYFAAIEEWARADVAPIERFIYEELFLQDVANVTFDHPAQGADDFGLIEEWVFLLVNPPLPFVYDVVPTVYDWLEIGFEPWKVEGFDEIVITKDVAYAYVVHAPVFGIENVSVTEWVSVQITALAWYLGVADNVTVEEPFIWGLDPVPLLSYDEVLAVELVTLTDLVIELFGDDIPSVEEAVDLKPDVLHVGAFDEVSLVEDMVPDLIVGIEAVDALTLEETVEAFPDALFPVAFDEVGAGEEPGLYLDISLAALDEATAVESLVYALDQIALQTDDSISINEFNELQGILYILVADDIGISLAAFVLPSELFAGISEDISLTEAPEVAPWPLVMAIQDIFISELGDATGQPLTLEFEDISLTETVNVSLDSLVVTGTDDLISSEETTISLSELITAVFSDVWAVEDAQALPDNLWLSGASDVAFIEGIEMSLPILALSEEDSLTVEDWVAVIPALEPWAWDGVAVEDFGDVDLGNLFLGVGQDVSIEEFTGISGESFIFGASDALVNEFSQVGLFSAFYLLNVGDDSAVEEANYQYLPIHTELVDNLLIEEATEWGLGIEFAGEDAVGVAEDDEVRFDFLLPDVLELVTIDDSCYTRFDYILPVYDTVNVDEWFVWGLSTVPLLIIESVNASEAIGIFIPPYELFPMLFDAPERGY